MNQRLLGGLMTTFVITRISCIATQPMFAKVSADSLRILRARGIRRHLLKAAKSEEGDDSDAEPSQMPLCTILFIVAHNNTRRCFTWPALLLAGFAASSRRCGIGSFFRGW